MIAYASRTGTKRNLDGLRLAGWRLMVSARGVLRTEGFRYALDNGAWTAFQRSEPFDAAAFEKAVKLLGVDADFIVVPDIVVGGTASLDFSRSWLRKLRRRKALVGQTLLIAVQNGMEPRHVRRLINARVGIFVGGDTDWKLATMRQWVDLAHSRGAKCHVGRVNSAKRARLCDIAGADSFDGSGPSMYADCLRRVDRAFDQRDLEGYARRQAA